MARYPAHFVEKMCNLADRYDANMREIGAIGDMLLYRADLTYAEITDLGKRARAIADDNQEILLKVFGYATSAARMERDNTQQKGGV